MSKQINEGLIIKAMVIVKVNMESKLTLFTFLNTCRYLLLKRNKFLCHLN